MSDSIRMMDLAVLSRNLEEFRRLDPEQRLHAERMAARATVRHLEQAREDVASATATAETRVDERAGQGGGHRHGKRHHAVDSDPAEDANPEREEGRLLDIKV